MRRSPNRIVGAIVGALLLAIGATGIVVSSLQGVGFAGPAVPVLGVLAANPLLGCIQAAVGGLLVAGAIAGVAASRLANAWLGAALLVFGLASLFLIGAEPNPLGVTATVNAVHFGFSALLLLVGLGAERPGDGER